MWVFSEEEMLIDGIWGWPGGAGGKHLSLLSVYIPKYNVNKATIMFIIFSCLSQTNPLEQTSFILTGIRPRATYYAQVAAKDFLDHGEYSAWSSPAFGAAWVPE